MRAIKGAGDRIELDAHDATLDVVECNVGPGYRDHAARLLSHLSRSGSIAVEPHGGGADLYARVRLSARAWVVETNGAHSHRNREGERGPLVGALGASPISPNFTLHDLAVHQAAIVVRV